MHLRRPIRNEKLPCGEWLPCFPAKWLAPFGWCGFCVWRRHRASGGWCTNTSCPSEELEFVGSQSRTSVRPMAVQSRCPAVVNGYFAFKTMKRFAFPPNSSALFCFSDHELKNWFCWICSSSLTKSKKSALINESTYLDDLNSVEPFDIDFVRVVSFDRFSSPPMVVDEIQNVGGAIVYDVILGIARVRLSADCQRYRIRTVAPEYIRERERWKQLP